MDEFEKYFEGDWKGAAYARFCWAGDSNYIFKLVEYQFGSNVKFIMVSKENLNICSVENNGQVFMGYDSKYISKAVVKAIISFKRDFE